MAKRKIKNKKSIETNTSKSGGHNVKSNHVHSKKKSPMSTGTIMVLIFLGGILLYSGATAFSSGNGNLDLQLEGFAECLVESDATFYGTEWCGFCTQQKEILGDVFRQFSNHFFVDCDRYRSQCSAAGVTGYPTWVINGQRYVGVQSIDALSNAMGCEF